jgi:alpha/beta hydrolase fold
LAAAAAWDLIVYHGELLDRLELKSPVLVGHSFGGLVACEIAATMPERVSKVVLIDMPASNWMLLSPTDLRAALFADPKGEHAEKFFQMPSDTAARIDARVVMLDGAGHMPHFRSGGKRGEAGRRISRRSRMPEGFLLIGTSRPAAAFCATAGNNAYPQTSADEKRRIGAAA